MTPRERAKQLQLKIWPLGKDETLNAIAQAITAAVEEEREECASILDNADVETYCGFQVSELARQIRARCNTFATETCNTQSKIG